MKITANQVKQLCGNVSYKRGLAFFNSGKVEITSLTDDMSEAIVHAAEDFYVRIERQDEKNVKATCSCPPLANFTLQCQHVAAVLLAIEEQQRLTSGDQLTNDFMSIFQRSKPRNSLKQSHFEQRKELAVRYALKPQQIGEDELLWAMSLEVDGQLIDEPRSFLQAILLGASYHHFDPKQHCFSALDDAILQQLLQMVRDERLYGARPNDEVALIVPTSSWLALAPLIAQAEQVTVHEGGRKFHHVEIVQGTPPLIFDLKEQQEDVVLTLAGFDQMLIFASYQMLFSNGKLYQLTQQDSERLLELKRMMQKTSQITIVRTQFEFFMKQIVPNLKKLGQVKLSPKLQRELLQTPLIAHLYLDRLRGRLLAGVEFHYGQVIIQPLEDQPINAIVQRDEERENALLKVFDESGFTKTDGGFYMQNDELEYNFLMHVLPSLQKQMKVYATTAVRFRVAKNTVFPRIRVKKHSERTNWVEFTFELDGIRDAEIQNVLSALQLKQKFYRLPDGALLSLETREMEEIQRFLKAVPIQEDGYVASFDLPITESLKFLELFEDSEAFEMEASFQELTQHLLHPERLTFEVPETLRPILRDYQRHGFQWMKLLSHYGFGGILADDMGLGKTLQSIAFIVSELDIIRGQKRPVIIVCPSSLTYNWLQECTKFAPELQAIIVDGSATERRQLLSNLDNVDVVITSYPLLRRDIHLYEQQQFHTVFFDEAQAFKNPTTQTARTVRKIQSDHRFALTGTPMENALEELWSIFRVIFPQLLGTLEEFSHLQNKDVARRVRPFLLRRMKEQVLGELPEKLETIETSELLPEQKKLYAAYLAKLRHDTLKHLDKETFRQNKVRILAGITRLRQLCCHPALFVDGYQGDSAKYQQLLSILEEAQASGRRVLIFSQFTQMLKLIAKALNDRNVAYFYLDGTTPSEERVEMCHHFNEGERDIFLISLKAGGTGLNLTGADTVILYDLWWNPAVEEQAADRAHRMGQKKSVQVIKMIARGTIEEKMHELQQKKRHLIADILDPDAVNPSTLTEDDVREILMI